MFFCFQTTQSFEEKIKLRQRKKGKIKREKGKVKKKKERKEKRREKR